MNKNKIKTTWQNGWRKWKSLKKRWKFLIIIVLLIAGGAVWGRINSQKQIAANREVVTVTREDLKKEAIRSGQVELQGVVDVKPPISGVITELLVENGQYVQEGDQLFKIKSNATAAELNQAYASYLAAKNSYEDAKISIGNSEWGDFESYKKAMMEVEEKVRLFEEAYPDKKNNNEKEYQALKLEESIARHNLDMATLYPSRVDDRLNAAKASYQAAAASYNASKNGVYTAPVNGWIENLGVNEGENVIADVGDKAGTPLFLIVPAGKKTISMQIGPNDAMVLVVGQEATVRSDYLKDATFPAQIVRIDKVGKMSDKGLTYRAWLEVEDTSDQLLLGSPVEVTMLTAQQWQTLVVPTLAVVDNTVQIVNEKGDFLETRSVETGLKASGKVEIVSGVNEGEFVLIDKNK
ncbi:MAG: efflux RND transporter periplasmic adaptor subunit [bacterium]|nr:efflux RND transporter periplasmic adaptor subunit [bacterium]